MNFTTLPDVALLAIFNNLCPSDLLQNRVVCRQFDGLTLPAFFQRRSLDLNLKSGIISNSPDSFHLQELTLSKAFRMRSIFRNLKCLSIRVVCNSPDDATAFETLRKFIITWALQLTSLSLTIEFDPLFSFKPNVECSNGVTNKLFGLLHAVNQMLKLRHFSLTILTHRASNEVNQLLRRYQSLDLPVFARLHTFSLHCDHAHLDLHSSFHKHAQHSASLRRVRIETKSVESTVNLTNLNPTFLAKIDRLQRVLLPVFERTAHCYTNLTKLSVFEPDVFTSLSLVKFVNLVAPLKRLEHLILGAHNTCLSLEDHIPSDQIAQLPSIKSFELFYMETNHTAGHSVHFEWVFPNVEQVSVYNIATDCYECCSYEEMDQFDANHCCWLMAQPWRPLLKARLRSIRTKIGTGSDNSFLWI